MSTKVFVGNLAFRTTDQALQEAFSKYGKVKSGVIITRGRRSLGYGFVEFSTTEEAEASVQGMNRAELFSRTIKVELAKDPADRSVPTEGEPGPARRRSRSFRRERAPRSESNTTPPAERTYNANEGDGEERAPRRKRLPPKKTTSGGTSTTTTTSTSESAHAKLPPREKVPSKTTLFVANLPFSVDDDNLKAIFADTKVKAAHVVRTRTGRSRGYGFVEFENEADQQAALTSKHGKPVPTGGDKEPKERTISVSISNSATSTTPDGPADAETTS